MRALPVNLNPGRDYELAIGLSIARRFALSDVTIIAEIDRHPKRRSILEMATEILPQITQLNLVPTGATVFELIDATQDDKVGPSDWIIRYQIGSMVESLGISVKHGVDVSCNPSGRKFLTEAQIAAFQRTLRHKTIPEFVEEMTAKFGRRIPDSRGHDNWYRKASATTTKFIHEIGIAVAKRWNEGMTPDERAALAHFLSHNRSTIPYIVVNHLSNPTRVSVVAEDQAKLMFLDSAKVVSRARPSSQYVDFFYGGDKEIPIARMQVKFNDGILRHKDGKAVVGDPFSSWNFGFVNAGVP